MNKNKQPIKKLGKGKGFLAGAALGLGSITGSFATHESASAQDATPQSTEQSAQDTSTDTTEPSDVSASSTSTTSTTEVPTSETTLVESTTTTAQETDQNPLVCDPETNITVPTGEFDPTTGNPLFNVYDKNGNLCGTSVVSPILTQEPPAVVQGTQVEQLPRTGNSLGTLGLAGASLVAAGGLAVAEAEKRRRAQTPNS